MSKSKLREKDQNETRIAFSRLDGSKLNRNDYGLGGGLWQLFPVGGS